MIVVFPFIVTVLEGNQFISSYILLNHTFVQFHFFACCSRILLIRYCFICVFCIVVKAVSQITHWVITSPSLNKEYCIVLYCPIVYRYIDSFLLIQCTEVLGLLMACLCTWLTQVLGLLQCTLKQAKYLSKPLRTVPTNGKYFFPDNDYVRQVDHIRGY